jgi:hypothetical protein
VFWLAGRLIGLDRPFSGPTGRAWLDAEDAFDRARPKFKPAAAVEDDALAAEDQG